MNCHEAWRKATTYPAPIPCAPAGLLRMSWQMLTSSNKAIPRLCGRTAITFALYHDIFLSSPLGNDAAFTCSLYLPMTSSIITGMRESAGGRHERKDDVVGGVPRAPVDFSSHRLLRLFVPLNRDEGVWDREVNRPPLPPWGRPPPWSRVLTLSLYITVRPMTPRQPSRSNVADPGMFLGVVVHCFLSCLSANGPPVRPFGPSRLFFSDIYSVTRGSFFPSDIVSASIYFSCFPSHPCA